MTFAATLTPSSLAGGKPVLVDVEPGPIYDVRAVERP